MEIPLGRLKLSEIATYMGRVGIYRLVILRSVAYGRLRENVENSAVRGSAARLAQRRWGAIQGHPIRSAEIKRDRHLLWPKGWGFAPHESAVDCVEISPGGPRNIGGSRVRHLAGSAATGRDSGEFRPTCRNSAKSSLTWAEGVEFRTP